MFYHPEALKTLLQDFSPRLRDKALLCILTGLRSTELRRVRPECISKAPKGAATPAVLVMPAEAAKTRKERRLGFSVAGLKIVSRCAENRPEDGALFGEGNQHVSFIRAAKRTGYDKRIILREHLYYFATTTLKVMVDVTATMTALGHSDARMTARDLHSTLAKTTAAGAVVTKKD